MAERRRAWNTEDDLPVYLARPGSAAQTPRQKYGGMFAAVEGAYENKTIDFDAYSVGRRGSARTPRSAGRPDAVGLPCPGGSEDTASDVSEPSGSAVSSPGDRDDRPPALRIRCPAPRDLPLGRDNGQVPSGHVGQTWGGGALGDPVLGWREGECGNPLPPGSGGLQRPLPHFILQEVQRGCRIGQGWPAEPQKAKARF